MPSRAIIVTVKLGIVGDAHLGCTDYTERRRADFAQAFKNAIETCLAEGVGALCLLGDVFDSALMRRNVEAFAGTVREVGPLFDRLRREGVPVLAVAGNHEFGRGRQAAELDILETLGFLRVLDGEAHVLDECAVVGFPYQPEDQIASLRERVSEVARRTRARSRILLLHNFVRGSKFIPTFVPGQIDPNTAHGFARAFVGHHHDAEEIGRFVMPGATEVQDLNEVEREKAVVIYDTASDAITFRKLPKTRHVLVLKHDIAEFSDRDQLLYALSKRLQGVPEGAFVCVRLHGDSGGDPRRSITKREVLAFLREMGMSDPFVEIKTKTAVRVATEAVRGATIDARIHRAFGKQAPRAQRYLTDCVDEGFPANLVKGLMQ